MMKWKQLGLGLVAFTAGAVAWTVGIGRFGPRISKAGGEDRSTSGIGAGTGADAAGATSTTASTSSTGHVPTDLLSDSAPVGDERAPVAFRPDPTAVPTAEEREALRPATGPAPSMVADRGSGFSEAAGAA